MLVLVTGGPTESEIDTVRVIKNKFRGSTGTQIAEYFAEQGDEVILLTSDDRVKRESLPGVQVMKFHTFTHLHDFMKKCIVEYQPDVVIHSAAVNDYDVSTVEALVDGEWVEQDRSTKIGSDFNTMRMTMVKLPKIIDRIRGWGFKGVLVKFKLQSGMTDEQLIDVAKKSMEHSNADLIVANCFEWFTQRAYIIDKDACMNVKRNHLPFMLRKVVLEYLK